MLEVELTGEHSFITTRSNQNYYVLPARFHAHSPGGCTISTTISPPLNSHQWGNIAYLCDTMYIL